MSHDVTRREFLHAGLTSTALLAQGRAAQTPAARRPNVLFILADDLGYGDLSCYGRPDYRTPVIDGLAREGIKFMSAYAAAPVCTPTRCALATGRYPQRVDVGLYEPLTGRDLDQGLAPDHPTVASLVKANGYDTALIGKWHLGWKPEFGPNRHGYDEFFGVLSGADDYFTHTSADSKGSDLWENLAPIERVGYLTDLLSDRAAEFVARPRTRPFFLSLHYTAPHSPWEGPEDAAIGHTSHGPGPMTDGGSLKIFASMMTSMDTGIGRVLDALRRASRDRDTLVDLHERQRRRALLVQLALLVPEDVPVGRRHPRAGDRALARRGPGRSHHRSGRHHDGLDGDHPGRDRDVARPRAIPSTVRI